MKANFIVDPDFPVIDGIGHSDKIDFFDVKGGGSTNTTFLDGGYDGFHLCECSRTPVALGTNQQSCRVGPSLAVDGSGLWQTNAADCLNPIPLGDSVYSRNNDCVLLNRIEVSGVCRRLPGSDTEDFDNLPVVPKVFVCLALDTQANGAAISSGSLFYPGNSINATASSFYSGVPFLSPLGTFGGAPVVPNKRWRVLSYDVIDFALNPETRYDWVDYADTTTTEGGPLPVPETTTIVTRTRYSFWRSVALGFRFDVDLNDVVQSFKSSTHSVADIVDNALHVFAVCFDGVSTDGYTPHAFARVELSYISRCWFADYLSPSVFAPAGVDGAVVPDDEVPLAILADQSGLMAGDGTFLERPVKRTKASHGFFNFLPRAGDAMLFEDDPEFARLQAPGANRGPTRKADSRSRVYPIAARRWKAHKYDDNEDYYAREGDRGGKRGKY